MNNIPNTSNPRVRFIFDIRQYEIQTIVTGLVNGLRRKGVNMSTQDISFSGVSLLYLSVDQAGVKTIEFWCSEFRLPYERIEIS